MANKAKDDAIKANFTSLDFADAREELETIKGEMELVRARWNRRRKRWKSRGLVLGEYDAVMKLAGMDGGEVKEKEVTRHRYATWMRVDLGYQATFDFGSIEAPSPEATDKLAKFDAYRQGIADGRAGAGRSANPHAAGTIANVAWDQGFNDHDSEEWKAAEPERKAAKKAAKKGAGPEVGATPADGDNSIH